MNKDQQKHPISIHTDLRLGHPPIGISAFIHRHQPDLEVEMNEVHARCSEFLQSFHIPHLRNSEQESEKNRGRLDDVLVHKLNQYGFLSLWIPRFLGGRGYHPLTMNIFNELIGSYCLGTANIVGAHYVGLTLLTLSQNFKILRTLGQEISAGERSGTPCLISAAITEPTAGSDKEDFSLLKKSKAGSWAHAERDGYLLNGSKIFISNASWAKYHVVVTTETPETPERGAVLLVVPNATPGLTVGPAEKKLGQHACPASMLYFHHCLIRPEWVALAPKTMNNPKNYQAYSKMINSSVLALTRSGVAMLSVASCAASLRTASQHLQDIESQHALCQTQQAQMGILASHYWTVKDLAWNSSLASLETGPFRDLMRPTTYLFLKKCPQWILDFIGKGLARSSIQSKLCDINLSKYSFKNAESSLALSSSAKLMGSNLAMESAQLALKLIGAACFGTNSFDLFKIIRDSKLLQIYEGTNQLNALHAFSGLGHFQTPLFEDPWVEDSNA
jgi:acyl-CoA dehydrogenase